MVSKNIKSTTQKSLAKSKSSLVSASKKIQKPRKTPTVPKSVPKAKRKVAQQRVSRFAFVTGLS